MKRLGFPEVDFTMTKVVYIIKSLSQVGGLLSTLGGGCSHDEK